MKRKYGGKNKLYKSILAAAIALASANVVASDAWEALKAGDHATGFRLMLKDAEAGKVDAQHGVCVLYIEGMGTPKNRDKAVQWCTLAANRGSVHSHTSLGHIYLSEKNYKDAYKEYSLSAAANDFAGQMQLGWMNKEGLGVPKDNAVAVQWYLKAAQHTNLIDVTRAWLQLFVMYMNGEGVRQDGAEAMRYVQMAVDRGHPDGYYYLGLCYLKGLGGKAVDKAAAKTWLTKAAAGGNQDAAQLLKTL